jgi:hypothetical protein
MPKINAFHPVMAREKSTPKLFSNFGGEVFFFLFDTIT